MEALLQLMKKKNYTEISVGEIAARAGVHRATFYRHFTSKDDVLRCVFQSFYENKTQMLLLNQAGLSGQLLDVLKDYFRFDVIPDIVTDGPEEETGTESGAGEARASTNIEKYRMAYRIGGIYSCLLLWFSHDMRETPEEMTRIAASI